MTRSLRTWMIAAALLAAAAPLAAQRKGKHGRSSDDSHRSRIDTTVAVSAGVTVDLSLMSGEIKVTSWERNAVRVVATSEEGDLRFEASSRRVSLSTDDDYGNGGETEYEVTVPKSARLIAETVSANIAVRGVAELEATAVSGDVIVSAIAGRATLETVSGELQATDIGGDVRAQNVSGDVEITGVGGELNVETVSGDLKLRSVKSSYVRTETVSGELEFDGAVDPKGRYEFHTHSGSVVITLPRGAGATVSMRGFSGEISSSCQMMLMPGSSPGGGHSKSTTFTIGGGGARFNIETFSGDIEIKGCSTTKSKED